MALPPEIPGLGYSDAAPLLNVDFDALAWGLTPEDYFLLTRVDGRTSIRQLVVISAVPEERAVAALRKLRSAGALYFPGEIPQKRRPPPPPEPPPIVEAAPPPLPPTPERPPPEIDESLLDEPCDLTFEQKRAILIKHAIITTRGDLLELFEVGPEVDRRGLKRAYFKISKDFHPDRFYGKNLGSYKPRLDEIFKYATDAFELLEDDGKRAQYIAGVQGQAAQTTAEHAAALFEQACRDEAMGDQAKALAAFAAAIRQDPQPRYLRRAAEACLRAQELRSAEEYAKRAAELEPRDAVTHRTLAKVYRAQTRISDARRELELAHRLDPENRHIASELDELEGLARRQGAVNEPTP